MIDAAITLLRNELQAYINFRDASVNVVVDNIGLLETSRGDGLLNSVILTLVNIEEESTLKNQPALQRPGMQRAEYQNPPTCLNLYVLFTCNYAGDDYRLALRRLALVIQFLQGKNAFSYASSVTGSGIVLDDPSILDLKFTTELYTMTFEQINHLWGSLGGRQVPFAMYKLRLVAITDKSIAGSSPLIEEISSSVHVAG